MKATRLFLAAMVLGTTAGASQANAQCSGQNTCTSPAHTASVSVGNLVKLGMPSSSTTLTSPTADDIDAGNMVGPDAGPVLSIKANRSWTLKIKSGNATNWTFAGTGAGVKPISDLLWALGSGGSYVAITNGDVTFTSGGTSTNGASAQPYFKTQWTADFTSASNLPGTYSLPIIFTLSAP
jgi:hypothetical protein